MNTHLDDIHFVTGRNYLYCHDNSIIDSTNTNTNTIHSKMCFHFLSLVDMNIHHPVIDLSLSCYPYTSYKGINNKIIIIITHHYYYHHYY